MSFDQALCSPHLLASPNDFSSFDSSEHDGGRIALMFVAGIMPCAELVLGDVHQESKSHHRPGPFGKCLSCL